jgi:hypothetical protein
MTIFSLLIIARIFKSQPKMQRDIIQHGAAGGIGKASKLALFLIEVKDALETFTKTRSGCW